MLTYKRGQCLIRLNGRKMANLRLRLKSAYNKLTRAYCLFRDKLGFQFINNSKNIFFCKKIGDIFDFYWSKIITCFSLYKFSHVFRQNAKDVLRKSNSQC